MFTKSGVLFVNNNNLVRQTKTVHYVFRIYAKFETEFQIQGHLINDYRRDSRQTVNCSTIKPAGFGVRMVDGCSALD